MSENRYIDANPSRGKARKKTPTFVAPRPNYDLRFRNLRTTVENMFVIYRSQAREGRTENSLRARQSALQQIDRFLGSLPSDIRPAYEGKISLLRKSFGDL